MSQIKKTYDLKNLLELAGDDNNFIEDIVIYIIHNCPLVIDKMRNFYAKNDFEKLRIEAHKLGSSLSIIGLTSATRMAEKIEEYTVNSVNLGKLPELISEIDEICGTAITDLKKDFKQPC